MTGKEEPWSDAKKKKDRKNRPKDGEAIKFKSGVTRGDQTRGNFRVH